MKKMKKKTKNIVMSAVLIAAIAVSGAFAYLTDSDTATNTFTMGNVDIVLNENLWDALPDANANDIPDAAEHLVSTQVITKDPSIANEGANDAYVYLSVEVPKASIITADANGNVLNDGVAAITELFSYAPDTDTTTGHWTLYGSKTDGADSNIYLYYYNTALAPDAETETLFDEVTFANVIEGQINVDAEMLVEVNAYAIQADFSDGSAETAKTPAQAWSLYATQNAGATLPVFTPVAP